MSGNAEITPLHRRYRGGARSARGASAITPPILHNQKGKTNMKLNEAIKEMAVKNWERRENSDGKRVVYVRFAPKESSVTIDVKDG